MDFNRLFRSNAARWIFAVLGLCIVALLSFSVGVSVGYRKAAFSYDWRRGYSRNFGELPLRMMLLPPEPSSMMSAHGTAGSIVQMTPSDLVIVDRDGIEKTITLSPSTMIRDNNGILRFPDLKVGDQVIIIGAPDSEGRIEARFIRVFR